MNNIRKNNFININRDWGREKNKNMWWILENLVVESFFEERID